MIARAFSTFTDLETKPVYQYGALAAITLLAVLLRFYKLGEWSFWIDEIFTIGRIQAHYSSFEAIIHNVPPSTNWFPISLLSTSGILNVLGVNEWSARLASAIIGIASIPMLYFPIRILFGVGVGLISALILAISPWHLFWSQNARFYTALMLFYTLALFAFFFAIERNRLRYLLLGMLLFYLAMSERIFALFLGPVMAGYLVALWLLPFEKPAGLQRRNILILLIPVIAGVAIEAYSFITSGSSRFFADFDWFFLYLNNTPLRLLSLISFDIGLPLITLASFGGLYLVAQKSRAGLLLVVGIVLPLGLLLPLSPFMFTQSRYVFMTLPCWIILAAVAVKELWAHARYPRTILAVGVLALLLADTAGDVLLYYRVNQGNRRDWRGAFTLVRERSRADDAVVAYWPEFGPYYLGKEITPWEELHPKTVMDSGRRFWFVTDSETVWANGRLKVWLEHNAELIDVYYRRLPEDLSLRIYLYDPAREISAR